MNILDLAHELNLNPKRAAATSGGEYKSACPKCKEGRDRFCLWPNHGPTGRYWCRVCRCGGDGIQFCRDFLGLTYPDACRRLGQVPSQSKSSHKAYYRPKPRFVPHKADEPSDVWKRRAGAFVKASCEQLQQAPQALSHLKERRLTKETIQQFSLGWNTADLFEDRIEWGLQADDAGTGCSKKVWLPKGIVIPSYSPEGEIIKLKIRRLDGAPKYVEVSASKQCPSIWGATSKPIIIVESELDAILIQQEAADLVCSVALGGVGKRPDQEIHGWLCAAPVVLLSLDHDEVGKQGYVFWAQHYPNVSRWPVPHTKSLGDAISVVDFDIRNWIARCI